MTHPTETTDTMLKISRIIPASPDEVFEAWTNPSIMAKWSAPEGVIHIGIEVDLQVGGEYEIRMSDTGGKRYTAYGTYTDIDRPHRIVYTWDWREEGHRMGTPTRVTVEFNQVGNKTELVLTHDRFPSPEAVTGHSLGWASCMEQFEALFS